MRKWLRIGALAALAGSSAPAFAGGAGSAALLWEKDAICAAQRRGEGPMFPNMCEPDYPAAPIPAERRRRR